MWMQYHHTANTVATTLLVSLDKYNQCVVVCGKSNTVCGCKRNRKREEGIARSKNQSHLRVAENITFAA